MYTCDLLDLHDFSHQAKGIITYQVITHTYDTTTALYPYIIVTKHKMFIDILLQLLL